MSCGPVHEGPSGPVPRTPLGWLGHEGFRLFFPLGAIHAALWPLIWVLVQGLDLPMARMVPASIWHGYELLVGAYGAALIGFLTTAAPEWTDTAPLRGRPLWWLAALWGIARLVGFLGWDGIGMLGGAADLLWMGALILYLLQLSWRRKTDILLAFVFWLMLLFGAMATSRLAFALGDIDLAQQSTYMFGFGFLGVLGLALARIAVPVTNLVLDPTERSSPFRPHPGRLNLAPGLILLAMAGTLAGLNETVTGFLWIAAGAGFMDRVAEGFVGRQSFRAEILLLTGSSALAGSGLMMIGTAALGAGWSLYDGLHVALMGGLGLGVLAVYSVAGLLHANHSLPVPWQTRLAGVLLLASLVFRIGIDGVTGLAWLERSLPLASVLWAGAFLTWLAAYLPVFLRPPLGDPAPLPGDAGFATADIAVGE
ncbi:NnrS family protein [Pukyongiella litopenaei]|uniref:NnrS family protein n=1 Tax=Pukyongiella litopenaei TaxID=2605946 RepID=A0A2S0MPY9_9RHOB|nr:NnrS family protein [Pukyongiella litopenaei]AVO37959.1 NnrS family protein [Pukyongiella litopenaei]